jgi:putative tricarboxylic transport membrane protein
MKKNQVFAVAFWVCLGGFVMYSSCRFGLGSLRSPGPGLMPFLLGALLCLVAVYFLVTSLFGKNAEPDGDRKTEESGQSDSSIKKIALVVASLILYAFVLEKLGYVVATLFLLFGLFWTSGTTRLVAAISSIGTVLVTYFLFSYLGVTFPQGILKFIGV